MILRKIPFEKREPFIWYLLAASQLVMAAGGLWSHFFADKHPLLVGMLTGFSLVSNIFFLIQVRNLKEFQKR